MDESWRMRMGMPNFPRRRSIEETSSSGPTRSSLFNTTTTTTTTATTTETLDPDDFSDVFGGPPRSVISRKFSGGGEFTTRSTSFYREIFRPSVFVSPANGNGGRSLPAFRIPTRSEGFYGDIFGAEEGGGGGGGWRSRERSRPGSKAVSKSKSNSSSVLSSEELSPLRPAIRDDVALSSFASKLRPINVPSRWNSTTMMPEEPFKKHTMPAFPCNHSSYIDNNQYMENDYNDNYNRSFYHGISRRVSSPETISLEPNSYQSVKISVDDLELNSPSTPASSLCQEPEAKVGIHDNTMQEEEEEQEQEEEQEEDEVMSSYVIEITSDHREGAGEAVSIDEAIAWAKEKFQTSSSERTHEKDRSDEMEKRPNVHEFFYQQGDGHGIMHSPPMDEEQKDWTREEEKEQSEAKIEMDLLDEDIRLWSAGKETNIRLLLSTLHHILWPNSGWYAIPLTNLVESSHVKKAYQKARLCLHPDKLQQRGAKVPQKYVAEKAFSILQDAWAAFINQDVFFS